MTEPEEYLSLTEVAELVGVRASAVSNWRKRHPRTFPRSTQLSGQEVFSRPEIVRWLSGRTIPRNALLPHEPPGTKYAERLDSTTVHEQPSAPTDTRRPTRLLNALVKLRAGHEWGSYLELTLSLIYLRIHHPHRYEEALSQLDPDRTRAVLDSGPLFPGRSWRSMFESFPRSPADNRRLLDLMRLLVQFDLAGPDGPTPMVASLVEQLLAWESPSRAAASGQHFTPASVARCMVGVADPQAGARVHDPATGSGELLVAAAQHADSLRLSGNAMTKRFRRLSWLTAALHGVDVHLEPGYGLDDSLDDAHYDIVIANPPFNMPLPDSLPWEYSVFGEPPRHNANFGWLTDAFARLVPTGRAAVLMPNTTTTVAAGAEARIRATMVENGVVEGVVALPKRLFRSTAVPVSLWVLRARRRPGSDVLLIDASELGTMVDRVQRVLSDEDIRQITAELKSWRELTAAGQPYPGRRGFARAVPVGMLAEQDYVLSPSVPPRTSIPRLAAVIRDLEADAEAASAHQRGLGQITSPRDDDWRRVELGRICEVVAGPGTVSRGENQTGWIPLVRPSDIRGTRIVDDEILAVSPAHARELTRYRLAPGDIICTRTGTLGRYGIVSPEQAGWLVGPGCMRLRPSDEVDAAYLLHQLTAPWAQQWVVNHSSGSAIAHINTKTLARLPLALPSLRTQQVVGRALADMAAQMDRYSQLAEAARALLDQTVTTVMRDPTTVTDTTNSRE
jgi:type I restriction enzyme M protein